MCSWIIEKKKRRSNEKRLGKGDTHTPTPGHVFGHLVHCVFIKTKTGQDKSCTGSEGSWVHRIDTLFIQLAIEVLREIYTASIFPNNDNVPDKGPQRDIREGCDFSSLPRIDPPVPDSPLLPFQEVLLPKSPTSSIHSLPP